MSIEKLGPYDLKKTLGRGGMGTVYAGVDRNTGQPVAIKVLLAHVAEDNHFRGRFATEIETLKLLKHPNIVEIVGYGEEDGNLFYSMELVDGPSLYDEMKAGRRFSCQEVAQIGIEICAALRHAHDRGVIHRDMKPGNLLLDKSGHVKLSDFGIAKLFGGSQLTADGSVVGTADYMSPEQAQGLPVTTRSDLYSVGSVLYALLAQRPPFASKSLPETIKNLTFEKPAPIADLVPHTPPELAKIIDRLLDKDPERRIGTAQSLANRLKAIASESDELTVDNGGAVYIDDDFILSSGPLDPNKTAIPETVEAAPPTAALPSGIPESWPRRSEPTVIPPTVVQTKPGAVPPAEVRESSEQRSSRFVTVDEEQRRRTEIGTPVKPTEGPLWPYVAGLVVLVAIGVAGYVYGTAPKSADALYRSIREAKEADLEELFQREAAMRQFVERFPDDSRFEEVQQWLTYVESIKYPRRLQQRARLHGTAELLPVERDYLDALQTADTDPEVAIQKFETLVAVYGHLPQSSDIMSTCVASAQSQLEELKRLLVGHIEAHQKIVQQALQRAEELLAKDPKMAQTILRAIVRRYGNRPWAKEQVAAARKILADLENNVDSATD